MTASKENLLGKGLPEDISNGIWLVDKAKGMTSFDIIRQLRRITGVRKFGHAGTLDPMATGLMILASGRKTKELASFMGQTKEYTGTLRLGQTTASYDAESPIEEECSVEGVTLEKLLKYIPSFLGVIQQKPPAYSAIKQKGKKLYELARKGQEVQVEAREVEVFRYDLIEQRECDIDFEVKCSKGTYIRSLAHDLGQMAGYGAHLIALRRTKIGPYTIESASSLEELDVELKERMN